MIFCEDFILASPVANKFCRQIKKANPHLWKAIKNTQKSQAFQVAYANNYVRVLKGIIVDRSEVDVDFVEENEVKLKKSYFAKLDLTKYQRNFKGWKEPTVLKSTRLDPKTIILILLLILIPLLLLLFYNPGPLFIVVIFVVIFVLSF